MISFDEKSPHTLGEQMEAIDMDAAARGYVYEITGLTGSDKIDYTFSIENDVAEFHKQQVLQRKSMDKLRNDERYIKEVVELDSILQYMQD